MRQMLANLRMQNTSHSPSLPVEHTGDVLTFFHTCQPHTNAQIPLETSAARCLCEDKWNNYLKIKHKSSQKIESSSGSFYSNLFASWSILIKKYVGDIY